MKRILLAVSLAIIATGCAADDEGPVDATATVDAFDCGTLCDAEPQDTTHPCDMCGAGTVCVQLLGGTCSTISVTCKPAVAGCEQPVCSTTCDQAYCDPGGVSTCNGPPCPGVDIAGALHCYGV